MSTNFSNEELAVRIQQGETTLYAQLWEQTKRLWLMLSVRLYRAGKEQCAASGVEPDDVQQICFLALYDAVQAYNPQKGSLTSYFKYPLQKHFRELLHTRTSKRDPLNDCSSLDEPLNADEADSIAVVDALADDAAAQAFEDAEDRAFQAQMHDALEAAKEKSLDDTQRSIIDAIYSDGYTMSDVVRGNGIPPSKVRTEHMNALRNMRTQNPHLKEYAEHYITQHAYDWTSLQSFRNNQGSSPEILLERLLQKTGA